MPSSSLSVLIMTTLVLGAQPESPRTEALSTVLQPNGTATVVLECSAPKAIDHRLASVTLSTRLPLLTNGVNVVAGDQVNVVQRIDAGEANDLLGDRIPGFRQGDVVFAEVRRTAQGLTLRRWHAIGVANTQTDALLASEKDELDRLANLIAKSEDEETLSAYVRATRDTPRATLLRAHILRSALPDPARDDRPEIALLLIKTAIASPHRSDVLTYVTSFLSELDVWMTQDQRDIWLASSLTQITREIEKCEPKLTADAARYHAACIDLLIHLIAHSRGSRSPKIPMAIDDCVRAYDNLLTKSGDDENVAGLRAALQQARQQQSLSGTTKSIEYRNQR